jgi:hypothetical protein
MKKNDVALLVFYIILTIAMTGYVVQDKINATEDQIQIYSNGKVVKSIQWPAKNQKFEVSSDLGYIVVQIENNQVSVVDSNCRDHICVHTKAINQGGEMIVCLPNKMYVEIKKKNTIKSELDALSQ